MNNSYRMLIISIIIFFNISVTSAFSLPEPNESEISLDSYIFSNRMLVSFSNRINPLSASQKEEKKKFFSALANGNAYNPQFSYKSFSDKLEQFALSEENIEAKGFFAQKLQESLLSLRTQAKMLLPNDAAMFTNLSKQIYPAPDNTLVLEAWRIVKEMKLDEDEKSISPNDLKSILEQALKDYSLDDWQVEIAADMSARASVSPASCKVKISSSAMFSSEDAKRLTLHEIGVHAQRAHYGKKMPLKIFTTGLPGYLETEEGLAVYNEYRNGINAGLPLFAMRVLGVHWALKHSFFNTFKLLKNLGASDDIAWRITTRCKRGLKDTSKAGAYTKDVSYLRGFIKIKNLMKESPLLFEKLLKAGKVGVGDIMSGGLD